MAMKHAEHCASGIGFYCSAECAAENRPKVGFVVVGITVSTGRRMYECNERGVATTRDAKRAKVFPDQESADRWAAMCQSDSDRGRGGVRFNVEAKALDGYGRVKVEA